MANIEAVKVQGFQSHLDTAYDLAPGLNVFTGATDGGKTSGTMRAIRWLAFGEPSGEAFITSLKDKEGTVIKEADEAVVEVKLDNGLIVGKSRRKGKTKYWIKAGPDDEGTVFEKAEVPEEVKAALGIRKTNFGDFEAALNFSYQLQAPFLISEAASTGAKVLGKLAGTELVDAAIKAVGKDTFAARTQRTEAQKEIEQREEQLEQYENLEELQEQLNACEYLVEQIEEAQVRKEKLTGLDNNLKAAEAKLNEYYEVLLKLSDLPKIENDLKDVEKAQQRYDRLLDLYSQYGKLHSRIEELTEQLVKMNGLEAATSMLQAAEGEYSRLSVLDSLNKSYQKYTSQAKKAEEILQTTTDLDLADDLLRNGLEAQLLPRLELWKGLRQDYKAATERAERAQATLNTLQGVKEAEALLKGTDEAQERLATLYDLQRRYSVKAATLSSAQVKIGQAENDLKAAEADLAEAWEAAGGICPLCEQPHEGGSC